MRTFIVLLILGAASPAMAQIIQPPPRSTGGLFGGRRPVDPNRTSQELMLTLSLLAGYDDVLAPEGLGGSDPSLQVGGYTATASTELRYRRGRASRLFETSGRAYLNSYTSLGIRELVGGDLNMRGTTGLGRRTHLTADASVHYQPTFTLGGLSAAAPAFESGASPDYSATHGVAEQQWLTGSTSASMEQEWTTRHRTSLQYLVSQRRSINGAGLDGHEGTGWVRHQWNFRRRGGFRFGYRDSNQQTVDEFGQDRPFRSQTADMALTILKRFSATRRLEVTGGAGATRARTVAALGSEPYVFVVPSAMGSLRVDLVRTWAVTADVRRDVTVLQGISPQPFITEMASLSGGGTIAGRFELALTAGFSRGQASAGETGAFESTTGTAQLQWNASSWLAVVTSYNYYSHFLRDLAAIPVGFPSRYDRNQAHVGMTIRLPLFGAF